MAEPVSCVVAPTQAVKVPVIVGNGFTVITADPVLSPAFAVQLASDKTVTEYVLVVPNVTLKV